MEIDRNQPFLALWGECVACGMVLPIGVAAREARQDPPRFRERTRTTSQPEA